MFKTLLLGYGEVGKAIYENLKDKHEIDIISLGFEQLTRPIEENYVLLVSIPYNDKFIEIVKGYQEKINPMATIVFSTTAIGTCTQLHAVHSPIEGKHPDLAKSFNIMKRWLGGYNPIASQFFFDAGIKVMSVPKPEYTEFLKMRSTSVYGLNIEFARYCKSVTDDLGMPFDLTKDYDNDYNELYTSMDMKRFGRYVLDAPKGNIGGHCVVPNSKILDNQYPSIFLKEIYREK